MKPLHPPAPLTFDAKALSIPFFTFTIDNSDPSQTLNYSSCQMKLEPHTSEE
ncbi:unnamed protein product [Cuscuta europaea]|uniref:Uncharacterized protein n=1 Tax=Cuscuta europaea TaxID=41803 RepID=A0A9P0ZBG8_CUSEU|nr:unnamed protein product [Cuscuta europaea]